MDDARSPDVEPIRRRATWRHTDDSSSQFDRHDDDALADALAAEVAAVTSSIPIVNAGARTASYSADDLFAALMDDSQPEARVDLAQGVSADAEYLPFAASEAFPVASVPAFVDDAATVDAPVLAPESAVGVPLLAEEPPIIAEFVEEPRVLAEPAEDASGIAESVTENWGFTAEPVVAEPVVAEAPVVAEPPAPGDAFLPSVPPSGELDGPESPRVSMPPQYEPSQGEWRDLALYPFPSAIDSSSPDPEPVLDSDAEPEPEPEQEPAPETEAPAPIDATSFATERPSEPEYLMPPPLVEPPAPTAPGPAGGGGAAGRSFESLLEAAPPPSPGSMAVPPPGSQLPEPPRLRSLDDDALASVLNRTTADIGVAGALAELEVQMQLRDEDAREFETWERSLRAIGTDEALSAIESARERFAARFTIPFLTDEPASPPMQEPTFDPPGADVPTAPYDPFADSGPETMPPDVADALGESMELPSTGEGRLLDDEFADSQHVDETDWVSILNPEAAPAALAEPASIPLASGLPQPAQAPHDDAPVLADEAVVRQRAFSLEANNGEPTLLEYRAGRATRMFWQWFAVNSSIASIGVGAVVFGLGLSVRQALVAVLAGVALSLLPLGLATLAGKWSGQPTMVVSRAAFGVVGNLAPALLAVITRIFWGGAILCVIAVAAQETARLASGASAPAWVGLAALGAAFVIATLVALFGYALLVRFALVLGLISAVLIVGVVALTASSIDIGAALLVGDGPWAQVITGSVLVFSVLGLAWANAGSEVARYQRPGGSGAASIAFTMAGAAIPALLLVGYGVLLAASGGQFAGLASEPLGTLASVLPAWALIPLLAALSLGLICSLVLTVYSGGFSLQAAGVTLPRSASTLVIAAATAAAGLAFVAAGSDIRDLLVDAVTTLAVPVAAWAGIFACDLMIRNERFDGSALMRRRSTYGDVNWVNLGMLLLASAIGLGFTSAAVSGLDWQGYLWPLLGVTSESALAASDMGVIIALVLGLFAPLVAGVPRIRAQERASR